MSKPFNAAWSLLTAGELPVVALTVDRQHKIVAADYAYWQRIGLCEANTLEGTLLTDLFSSSSEHSPWGFLHTAWQQGEATAKQLVAGERVFDAVAQVVDAENNGNNAKTRCQVLLWDRTAEVAPQDAATTDSETLAQFTADLPAMLYQTQGNEAGTDMQVPYLSNRTEALTGRTIQELQDNPSLLLEAIHVDDRRLYYERALEAMAQKSTFCIDMRIVSTDGSSRWLRVTSHPRLLPDNSMRFSGVAVEIDDLMDQIAALRHSRDEMGKFTHDRFQQLINTKRDLEQEIEQRKRVHVELVKEQQALRKMLELQDQQRTVLSYDLHDGFVQDVVGAKMVLEGAQAADHPKAADLEFACHSLERAIHEARRMIGDLRQMDSEGEALLDGIESLRDLSRSTGLEVRLTQNIDNLKLPQALESHIFRMIQESLSNVRRHAQTKEAAINIDFEAGNLQIDICDQGVGFEPTDVSGLHFGLENIRQRARILGGTAEITSQPGAGTTVSIRLPVDQ